ncbi:Alpha/Beta hydrolase protein [Umbelopsis sp. AD052]|nr:Alpha/Beta hydrolase protein [Umbelopsis sp. AD052]
MFLQGTVKSSSPPIQYWRSGFSVNPDGDIIIFTPGAGLDHHSFDAQVLPLVLAGHRVVTYDPRCQGMSQVSNTTARESCTITFDLMLQDMNSMMIDLHIPAKQAVLQAGLSMGGMVAQQFAKVYPNRTKALIAMDCGPNEVLLPWMQYYLATPLDTLITNDNNASFNAILNTSNNTIARQEIYRELSESGDAEIVKAMKACAEVVVDDPTYTRLNIPELLLYGLLDGLTNTSMIEWYNRDIANPHISLVSVPNAGHVSSLDNPEGVVTALIAFLNIIKH